MLRIVKEDMPIPEDFSKDLKDFLQKCFNKDPSQRVDAKQLISDIWLVKNKEKLASKLLAYKPSINEPKSSPLQSEHSEFMGQDDPSENFKTENSRENKANRQRHKRLSQEEFEFLEKYNSTAKFEESKIRHKKTPAISIKNANFLETIKGFNYSNRNDNSQKIKYPKHDSNQSNNMAMQNTGNMENLAGTPMNQQEANQTKGIPTGVLRHDLRREDPLQGFSGSNKGSNGSGGIPNQHHLPQEPDKEVVANHPSYRQAKPKQEDRNALSQD